MTVTTSNIERDVAGESGRALTLEPRLASATRGTRLRGFLSRTFIDPLVPITFADQHRRARLLATLTLANVLLAAIGAAECWAYGSADTFQLVLPPLLLTAAAYSVAYGLSRVLRTRAASYIVVAAQLLIPLVVGSLLEPSEVDARSTAAWLSLAVLTTGVTLGTSEALAVGAAAVIGLVTLMSHLGGPTDAIGEAAFFLVVTTLLLLVYLTHRDGLEHDRQALLRSRNVELEELKATLEERVADRTEELARRTADLSRANATLGASQAMLIQTEKLAAVGRLTAGIAHELASPLSAALAALQDIGTLGEEYNRSIGDLSVTADDHRAIAKDVASAVSLARTANERAIKFVRGIRAHTRDPGPQATERFDLTAVVREAADLLAHESRATSVRVTIEPPDAPITIFGVPSRLNQAVTNLLKNAIDAIATDAKQGLVTIRLRRDGSETLLEIEDDGPGIAPEIVPRIFEPMFTTKAYGQGTGLGLAIVREIIEDELRGRVSVRSGAGRGATFVIALPCEDR